MDEDLLNYSALIIEEDVRTAAKFMGYNLSKYAEGYQLTKQDERDQENHPRHFPRAYCRFSQGAREPGEPFTSNGETTYEECNWQIRTNLAKAASRIKTRVKAAANRAAVAAIRANTAGTRAQRPAGSSGTGRPAGWRRAESKPLTAYR